MGVGLVVLALVAAIVLAATTPLDPESAGTAMSQEATAVPSIEPEPTPSLPNGGVPEVAPDIVPPATVLTADPVMDLEVVVPETPFRPRDLRIVIFRDGKEVTRSNTRGEQVTVSDVKLKLGENALTAALEGPGGMGPMSEPVLVALDNEPPEISLGAPRDGARTDDEDVTVRGSSEPGALVSIRNDARGAPYELTVGPDGTFRASVALAPRVNRISVRATDALGNQRTVTIKVIRNAFEAEVVLRVRPSSLSISQLPAPLRISITVADAAGDPVDGAPVVFTLGPFGQSAETFETETSDGRARWAKNIPRDGALRGEGKVSASVTLPDGTEVVERASFVFE
jgi:hypothetical protein